VGLPKKLQELNKVVDTQEIRSLECPRDAAAAQYQCGFWSDSVMSWKNICIKKYICAAITGMTWDTASELFLIAL